MDTLIMGIRDADALREILGIDGDQEVVSVIAVGYRDIDPAHAGQEERGGDCPFLLEWTEGDIWTGLTGYPL